MAFTAVGVDGTRYEAPFVVDEAWHRLRADHVVLLCPDPECRAPMVAREGSRRRHFAHKAQGRQQRCSFEGESSLHLALKWHITQAARTAGLVARMESFPAPTDAGGWRADVLVTAPDARRVAFEVQKSTQTDTVTRERTSRYAADGIAVVWLSVGSRLPTWFGAAPSIHIDSAGIDDGRPPSVVEGLARYVDHRWATPGAVPLDRIVTACVRPTLEPRPIPLLGVRLVRADQWSAYQADRDEETRRHAKEEAARRRLQANTALLLNRQRMTLRLALGALAEVRPGLAPCTLAVSRRRGRRVAWFRLSASVVDHGDFATEARYGFGVTIWAAPSTASGHLIAVVCPPTGRCSPEVGAAISQDGGVVLASTESEASKLQARLGVPVQTVETWSPIDARPDTSTSAGPPPDAAPAAGGAGSEATSASAPAADAARESQPSPEGNSSAEAVAPPPKETTARVPLRERVANWLNLR